MRRGDIYLATLSPARGTEADKRRPVAVVGNDGANTTAMRLGRGFVTVVPITSNVTRVYPFQVLLSAADTGLDRDSKAQAEQVRSIDVGRIGPLLGRLTPRLADALDDALRLHLNL